MEQFFKVKEHGSTVKIEVMAGITTFMAMAYILSASICKHHIPAAL